MQPWFIGWIERVPTDGSKSRFIERSHMKNFKKAPNYLREFGFLSGLKIFSAVELAKHLPSGQLITLSIPGYSHKIFLRDTVADCSIFWQCVVQCQYDTRRFPQNVRLMERYEEMLRKGETPLIIDCGGNIGLAAFWFARVFPRAKIVSIEPDKDNLEMLRLNTEGFSDRVTIVRGGIWDRSGSLRIVNPDSGSAAYRVEFSETQSPTSIPAYTIDDLCKLGGTDSPFVVKLDIEGAQSHLFSSNTDWVGRTNLITLELDDWLLPWQGSSRNFFACLSQYPFDYLLGGESIFCFRDSKI